MSAASYWSIKMRYEKNLTFKEFLEIQKKHLNSEESKVNKKFIGSTSISESIVGSKSFTGTNNFNESIEFIEKGYKNNSLEKGNLLEKLNLNSKNDLMFLDYQGLTLDFSEYTQGSPECMVNLQYTYEKAKNVNIYISSSFNCDINNKTIDLYGKMVLALIEILETKNVNTSLFSVFQSKGSNGNFFKSIIKLKDCNEIIDTDRISYCITHPSFLRRNLFRLMEETIPFRDLKEYFSGYGRSIVEIERLEENAIYINSLEENKSEKYFLDLFETTIENLK
jgi:hypothetical protein